MEALEFLLPDILGELYAQTCYVASRSWSSGCQQNKHGLAHHPETLEGLLRELATN